MDVAKKPVYILSGFLGSGKTSLLNRLLKRQAFANTLVIVNEFGEIALDHLLIEESSETILELSNGCLCCSIRGELIDTLLNLDPARFERIIIETTGIADPLPIFQSLAFHPDLSKTYSPARIITVYDCLRGMNLIENNEEAEKQLAIADAIVLTKQDLVPGNNDDALNELAAYTQTARIFDDPDMIAPDEIPHGTVVHTARHHSHATDYKSVLLETEEPMDTRALSGLLHHLCSILGEDLLRIKGFVKSGEPDQPALLVQVSGQVVHDFEPVKPAQNIEKTQLVVIVKNADPRMIRSGFNAFMNTLAIDTPDQDAMMNNPLSIPGFRI